MLGIEESYRGEEESDVNMGEEESDVSTGQEESDISKMFTQVKRFQ